MKKFLLVTFIGMALVMNLYCLVVKLISICEAEQAEEVYKGYKIVYVE